MTLAGLLAVLLLVPAVQDRPPAPREPDLVVRLLARLEAESVDGLIAGGLDGEATLERLLALRGLSAHLHEAGDYLRAEPLRREMLRISRELFGDDGPQVEETMHLLGSTLVRMGRHAESVELCRDLLERARTRAGDRSLEVGAALTLLGNSLWGVGEYDEVEERYSEALDLYFDLQGPRSATAAKALSNLSRFLQQAGLLGEAEELAREAHALSTELHGAESREAGVMLAILASVLADQVELEEAELTLREALRISRTAYGKDHPVVGTMLMSLGDLLLVRGDDLESLAHLQEGIEITRRSSGPRNQAVGGGLRTVALATARLGDLERALEVMVEARDITVEALGPEHPAAVARAVDLAHLVARSGDLEQAVEICLAARAPHAGDSDVARRLRAQATGPLGSFLRRLGRFDEAERELRTALSILEGPLGPEHGDLAFHHEQLALLYEERGDLELAIASAERARGIAEGHRTRLLGAELERALYAGALELGTKTRLVARLLVRGGEAARALDVSEAGRARAMLDLLSRSERALAQGGNEQLQRRIGAEEQARFAARAAEAAWVASGSVDERRRRTLATARAELDRASAEVNAFLRGSWADAQPLDTGAARAGLAPGERILSYLWSDRMVALFVVPAAESGELRVEVLAEGDDVSELGLGVEHLCRRLAEDPRARGGGIAPGELADLAQRLLPERVRLSLGDAERIVVLPDGPLDQLPLDVLWEPGAERPDLVYAPSATVYLNRVQLARDRGQSRGHAVVLGDPAFPQGEGVATARFGALRPLPATRVEAEFVASLFDGGEGARVLLGEGATREALERGAAGARIVHVATHGRHGTASHPYDAALALAHEVSGPEAFLTLDRLVGAWRGRLASCELVVLSACDTNRRVRAGTSSISLPWGFFYAGAPTVVASLWQVDELATALLMGRFYSNLTEPAVPMSKLQALREAKTWLRGASRRELRSVSAAMGLEAVAAGTRSPAPEPSDAETALSTAALFPYADPYFWSAFVLVGSPD